METPNSKKIQSLLNDLDITFIRCKFTYPQLDVKVIGASNKRRNTLYNLFKAAEDKLDELAGVSKEKYENCTFYPGDEEDLKKQISTYETETMKFKFIQCTFIRRESTLFENFIRKLRRIFGVMFELNYITGTAEVEGTKIKVKDIPDIIRIVVERIQDDK